MTQSKHTPAPWHLSDYTDDPTGYEIYNNVPLPEREMVAEIMNVSQANAQLIAAAPLLLKTLETVVLAHEHDGALTMGDAHLSPAILAQVQSAIEKAGV